eukprot:SAG11_NODE_3217_length_2604_cov_1.697006_1_plen_204_part_00
MAMGMALSTVHDAEIAEVALPALASHALEPLLSSVEAAAAGRMGTVALGALGLAEGAASMFSFGRIALTYSTTPLVAAALARGDGASASRTVAQGVALGMIVGTAQGVGMQVGGAALLRRMASSRTAGKEDTKRLVFEAAAYLRCISYGAPATMLGMVRLARTVPPKNLKEAFGCCRCCSTLAQPSERLGHAQYVTHLSVAQV